MSIPRKIRPSPKQMNEFIGRLQRSKAADLIKHGRDVRSQDKAATLLFASTFVAQDPRLWSKLQALQLCGIHSPRILRFTKPEPKGQWELDFQQPVTPAFGCSSVVQVAAVLQETAQACPQEAVACLVLPVPMLDDGPGLIASLFSDKTGRLALAISFESETAGNIQWLSVEPPEVRAILDSWLAPDMAASPKFFDDTATALQAYVRSESFPLDTDKQEAALAAWLRGTLAPLNDQSHAAQDRLCAFFMDALDLSADNHEQELEHRADVFADILKQKLSVQEKASANQLKRLTAQLEKADMLAKGAQARATRLEAELKPLRRQSTKVSAPTPDTHASLGAALDKLFAAA